MEENQSRYSMPGRPPRDPKNKVGVPVRCLVTRRVNQAMEEAVRIHGVTMSDVQRLAIYNLLQKDGLLTDELRQDMTFESLRAVGLV